MWLYDCIGFIIYNINMADKLTGFDRKINELQEKRAQLDLSFLQWQKQEFERRIAELLESPTDGNESEREALSKFNEVRECHAKIKDINNKIEHIPENAGELIEEIDRKLSFYKEKREETNKIPLYKDTEEWIAEIFWSDILQYARETNNIELINKLKTRSLTPRKYSRLLKEDYAKYKHEKMEKMYTELFTLEKSKPLENGNSSEQKNPSEGCNQEDDEQSPRKRRKIENPKDTLSKLDIGYQTVDWVILPTKWNIQTIRRSKAVLQNYTELDQEYEDKINILFSKVLTPENWFDSGDYNVITWMEPKHMVRRTTYVIVEIPQKNKMIILNNGYWEASFLCDEMFEKSLLTSVSKEELVKQYGENIKKLEFRDEETWIDEVLGRLGKNEKSGIGWEVIWKVEDVEEIGQEVNELQEQETEGLEGTTEWIRDLVDSWKKIEMKVQQWEDEEIEKEWIEGLEIPDYKNKKLRDRFIENNLTEDDFEKFNDEIDVLVCRLMKKNWQNFVLRNENLEIIQKEFFEWANKNRKLKIPFDKWINDRKKATMQVWDALESFMKDYFVEKTGKASELRKTINDDLYKKLEAHLLELQKSIDSLSEEEKKENKSEILWLLLAKSIDVAIIEEVKKCKEELKPGTIVNDFDFYYKLRDVLGVYGDYCLEKNNEEEKNDKMENLIRSMYESDMMRREDVNKFLKLLYQKKILDTKDIEDDIKNDMVRYINKDKKWTEKNFKIENVEGRLVPVLRIIEPYKDYVEILKNLWFSCENKWNKNSDSEEKMSSNVEIDIIEWEWQKVTKTIDDVVKYFGSKWVEINKSDLLDFLDKISVYSGGKNTDFERVIECLEKDKYFSFNRLKEIFALGILRDKIVKDEKDFQDLNDGISDEDSIANLKEEVKKWYLEMFKNVLKLLGCDKKYIKEIDNLNENFPDAVNSYINKYAKDWTLSAVVYKDWTFDFLTLQSEILHEAIDNCTVDKNMIKRLYRYLGFRIYDDCTLSKVDSNNIKYILNNLSGIVDYLRGEKKGCFSGAYYEKKPSWKNLGSLKGCSLFMDKKVSLKGCFLRSEQKYRLWIVYKDGYYLIIELFTHDEYENEKWDGWVNKKVSKREAKAFLSATGVRI